MQANCYLTTTLDANSGGIQLNYRIVKKRPCMLHVKKQKRPA